MSARQLLKTLPNVGSMIDCYLATYGFDKIKELVLLILEREKEKNNQRK